MRPRPSFAMKLIASGVANCAAMVRSPSFSRSAASTTTTNRPCRMSSIASSTLANGVTSLSALTRPIVPWSRLPTRLLSTFLPMRDLRQATYLTDFKEFLLRGNVVDLAVGIVIGAAFGTVVAAFVADLITPIIAAIIGKPDFSRLMFTINGSHFLYGAFLNAVIAFIPIAAAGFFLVVKPVNA